MIKNFITTIDYKTLIRLQSQEGKYTLSRKSKVAKQHDPMIRQKKKSLKIGRK